MDKNLAELSSHAQLESHGYAIVPDVLDSASCKAYADALALENAYAAGSRTLLASAWCQQLAQQLQERLQPRVQKDQPPVIPTHYRAVQCTYFEKSGKRNWLVSVHQDRSIPVASRIDHPALQGWSEKEGQWFVQPPVAVLEPLLALRLHLDDCGPDDGPLRVIAGSHQSGFIDPARAAQMRQQEPEVACCVARGGVVLMRPLLLHASSRSSGSSLRRVLHFVFAPPHLPFGLRWPEPS
ncbi:MAG: hypothetical protein RL748_3589 [Pseudomonadota bacterium]